jgi:hypothetical protein
VQAVAREEGDGDGLVLARRGVVQDGDGRGGSTPGRGGVERGDGSEAWEGLQAGATDHCDGDGSWSGGISVEDGMFGGIAVDFRRWRWQVCVPSYELAMLAILRKPICIWRLVGIDGWKSRNINTRLIVSSLGVSSTRNFFAPQHVPARSDAIWWGLVSVSGG